MSDTKTMNELRARPQDPPIVTYLKSEKTKRALAAVASKHLTAERMVMLCLNSIQKTPDLAKCEPLSVLGAIMTATALGLECNTPSQQAYLIPYDVKGKMRCEFQIGYRGYIALGERSGVVRQMKAAPYYEGDQWEYSDGLELKLVHTPNLSGQRGPLLAAWCMTKLKGDDVAVTVLPADEIWKIRSRSQTYESLRRLAEGASPDPKDDWKRRKFAETPWVLWEADMVMKSVIKKHYKMLPIFSGLLAVASAVDDGGSEIDFSAIGALAQDDSDARAKDLKQTMEGGDMPALTQEETLPQEEKPKDKPEKGLEKAKVTRLREARPEKEAPKEAHNPELFDPPPVDEFGDAV
jgi:recombination protein RecT